MGKLDSVRFVCVLVLFGMLAGCSDPASREAKYLRRGNELFEKADFAKARLEYRNAAAIRPTDPEVRYRLGLVDEAEGDLRNAFVNFMHSVEQDEHYRPAQIKVAQYYLGAEQYEQVEAHLKPVLADHPDDPDAHALEGGVALRQKSLDTAEKEARFALGKEPGNVMATSVLVGVLVQRDDRAAVAKTLADGIGRNPKDLGLLKLKAEVYSKFNDPDKVEEAYRAMFVLRPADRRLRAELAGYFISLKLIDRAEDSLKESMAALPADWELKRLWVEFLNQERGADRAEQEIRALMAANPKNDDLYFWLADVYLKNHATDKAVTLMNEVAERAKFESPGLTARNSLARISFSRGDRALAEKLIAIVLENSPDNHDALLMRASLEFEEGRLQAAVGDLRAVLRNQSKDKEALRMLAESLIRQRRVDLAIDTLSQLVDIDPLNVEAKVRLAQMYNINGDAKRGLALLGLVTQVQPGYPVAWESIARIALDTKDWAAAEPAIAKLAALKGQENVAAFLKARLLAETGKNEQAITLLTQVISADPASPLAEHAAEQLIEIGRATKRMEAVSHIFETIRGDAPAISIALAQSYLDLGKPDAAITVLDRLIADQVARPEPYLARARLYASQHDATNAIEVLAKGSHVVPGDFQLQLTRAEYLAQIGRNAEAQALYEDLLNRNPELDVAANNLAEMIADDPSSDNVVLEKARRYAERFQAGSNPLTLDTLAWVDYRQGNTAQASSLLERAFAQNGPVTAQMRYHYGAVLAKTGRKEEAKVQLQQALQKGDGFVGSEDAKTLLRSLQN